MRCCAGRARWLHRRRACRSHSGCSSLPCLQGTRWLAERPDTQIRQVRLEGGKGEFLLLRDDLLHPVLGGNKLRKLDALIPSLVQRGITDVLTCGGLQSAHCAAVAAACAEAGPAAHLLVRGERPAVPAGYHLLARMHGCVQYVSRAEYSDRAAMLRGREAQLRARLPHAKVHVIAEGAAEPLALLGLVRLVAHLAQQPPFAGCERCSLVVDSGTGTTATGLALGAALLQLPWRVASVMVAADEAYHRRQAVALAAAFLQQFPSPGVTPEAVAKGIDCLERARPRRFGKVFPGEIEACSQVAKAHGVLLDPIYTLAAWETASALASGSGSAPGTVAMLHTGGALGLQGLAQRYPDSF